jgi:hypothetical protein
VLPYIPAEVGIPGKQREGLSDPAANGYGLKVSLKPLGLTTGLPAAGPKQGQYVDVPA